MHRSHPSQPNHIRSRAAAWTSATSARAAKAFRITLAMLLLSVASGTAGRAEDAGREVFIFAPAELPEPMRQQFMLQFQNLVQNSGKLSLHLIEIPSHRVIASLSVPARLTSDAKRRPEFRLGWQQIRKFLHQAEIDAGAETPTVSIDLPMAFGKIAAIRQTEAAPEVLMIGDPLYSNPREPWFAMSPHYIFSDSAWFLDRSPFSRSLAPIPPGSEFIIVSIDPNWGLDSTHQSGTERFYRVGVQQRLKGNLQPITSDFATAFRSLRLRQYQQLPQVEIKSISPNAIGRDDRIWRTTVATVTFEPE